MSRPASNTSQNRPLSISNGLNNSLTDNSNNNNRTVSNNSNTTSTNNPTNSTIIPLTSSSKLSSVQVVCRVKPSPNYSKEQFIINNEESLIDITLVPKPETGVVNNNVFSHSFALNAVLPDTITQQEVFDICVKDIADSALDGISGCLLAYGQTGAGKTYTMSGPGTSYSNRGLIPRTISYICAAMESARQVIGDDKYTLRISYVEIYNDKIIDLLGKITNFEDTSINTTNNKLNNTSTTSSLPIPPSSSSLASASSTTTSYLQIQEDRKGRITIPGLITPIVRTEADALRWLFAGEANRALAEHALNKASTRSHCIFTLYLEQQMSMDEATGVVLTNKTKVVDPNKAKKKLRKKKYYGGIGVVSKAPIPGENTNQEDDNEDNDNDEEPEEKEINYVTVRSKLHLVDLAGSERLEKTASIGNIRKEAQAINKSLAFLEQVVVALLDKDRDHIPYRQSKLTHMLKDALGGHCRTRMIAAVWPDATHLEETVSTLRFATRMMRVRTTPVRDVTGNNNGLSEAERERLVTLYESEITALRMELALHDSLVQYNGNTTAAMHHNFNNIRYGPVSPGEMDILKESVRSFVDGKADMVPASTVRQLQTALYIMRDMVRNTETMLKTIPINNGKENTTTTNELSEHFRQRKVFPHSPNSRSKYIPPTNNENIQPATTIEEEKQMQPNIATPAPNTNEANENEEGLESPGLVYASNDTNNTISESTGITPSEAQEKFYNAEAKSAELEKWSTIGNGAGLHADYNTAKQSLKERKTNYNKLAHAVNESKQEIDKYLTLLRNIDNNINNTNESKEDITEALSKAKTLYRTQFENLQEIRTELDYLTKVSESYKQRIGTEFMEHWSKVCGMSNRNGNIKKSKGNNSKNNNQDFSGLLTENQSNFAITKPVLASTTNMNNTTTNLPSSPIRHTSTEYRINDPNGGGGVGSPDGKRVYEEGIRKAMYMNNNIKPINNNNPNKMKL